MFDNISETDCMQGIFMDDSYLTLRDRFAIAALCGPVSDLTGTAEWHAQIAYEYADAMLAERNRK